MIGKKGILRFFYKVMMVCYKKLHLWRIPIPGRDKVQADLNRMHPGENPQECVTDYYVTKLTLSAVILIAGIMLAITMHYSSRESHVLQNQWVYRGSGEEGSREYSITGQVEDGERYSFQMEVMPRKYSQSELENLYEQFGRELPQLILEKNDSPDEIRENLDLSETYEGYPFLVNWKSNSTEAVEENGQIHPGQEDVPVLLRAEIQYGEFVRETTVKVTVVKRNETPQEREKSKLSELLQRAQEEDPESEKIQLPTEIEGRKISWEEDIPETGWKILAGALLLAAASASSKGTNQIRQAVDELAATAASLAENVQTVNSRMLEMGDNVNAIHSETVTLNENSNKMDRANRNASESMNLVLESSHTSSDIITEMIVQVKATNEAIASISKAVELISDITAQTNLLSLNASIEAARAGQAGKGFAVVATEIKQLAEQSSQSADTIKKIADDILEKSNKSVELTERMRALAEKEQADIGGAKNGFDALSQIIEANVTTAGIIAEKTKNLEELKQTIINSITELSAISEENAASNEEVTANVSDIAEAVNKISDDTGTIKKVSTDLEELMQYFK